MDRVVHAHIKNLMPAQARPDEPVFRDGGARPDSRFRELCRLAGIGTKTDVETGEERAWMLKDLRNVAPKVESVLMDAMEQLLEMQRWNAA